MRGSSVKWPIWGAPFRSATNTLFIYFLTTGKLGSERGGLSTCLPGEGGGGVMFSCKYSFEIQRYQHSAFYVVADTQIHLRILELFLNFLGFHDDFQFSA